MTVRIANAAGFLGDHPDAPRRMAETAETDYLTLEYLAELTLSILAHQKEKDPTAGYAGDFLPAIESLAPALYLQPQLKLVTNAGGVNPASCAARAGAILAANGSGELPIGVVMGDDIFGQLEEIMAAGCGLENLDTGQPLAELTDEIVAANVYLGAAPICEALADSARIVITGRVADASLTVGPAAHEFGWEFSATQADWDRLAGATVAGHLIECGTQVTGGYSDAWRLQDLTDVGYPIAEIDEHGHATITKPASSGGRVTRETVVSQLVYEIGDPRHYLTPDVDVDFTSVEVSERATDEVLVWGATGNAAPGALKVSLAYRAGYTAAAELLVYGPDCIAKGEATARLVFARLERAGLKLEATHVELLGAGCAVPGLDAAPGELRELVLRIAVRDRRRAAVERFAREIAPLITSGPAGLAGYAGRRVRPQAAFAYWPTLIPRELVQPRVEVRKAKRWSELT